MSRNFELLCQLQKEREFFQRNLSSDTTDNSESDTSRLVAIEKRLFDEAEVPAGTLAHSEPHRATELFCAEASALVQRLFLGASLTALRSVVLSAVEPDCEYNCITAYVADLLATWSQESICLVDADLSNPSLHAYFKVDNHPGLANALLDPGPIENFSTPLGRGRLQLMSAGELPKGTDLNKILASGRLRTRLAELAAIFGFVVVHAPPAANNFVTSYLAALTDGLILVVEPRFTSRKAACDAKASVMAAGGRVLGVVLHQRELRFPIRIGPLHANSKPAWTF